MENPDLVLQETGDSQTLKARHIPGHLNVIADKVSRPGQTIQTEWSILPKVFQSICSQWYQPQVYLFVTNNSTCFTGTKTPGIGSGCTQPALGGCGPLWLPTSRHLGQSSGEVAGLPMRQNHSDCSRVAQHALVLGPSGHVEPNPIVPAQPFNQILHRNLSNLNLYGWLLEPQLSKSKASLRQWQHKLRLLKEFQPDQSMRQNGSFLQNGATVIRWTSGNYKVHS